MMLSARVVALALGACASTFALGLVAPSAKAADAVPFASPSGRCLHSDGGASVEFGSLSAAHPQAVVRVETAAGAGDFSLWPDLDHFGSDRLKGTFGGADATWVGTTSLAAGSTPSLTVGCYGAEADFDFRAELYDVPT